MLPVRRHHAIAVSCAVALVSTASACSAASPSPSNSAPPTLSTSTGSTATPTAPSTTATPTVTSSTSASVRPSSPSDLTLDGVDPCGLVTADARATRGITTQRADNGIDTPGQKGRSCGFGTGAATSYPGWSVQFWPTRSLDSFQRAIFENPTPVALAAFPALTEVKGGPGTNNLDVVCNVAVSTSPEQTLLVKTVLEAGEGGVAACRDATGLTLSVLTRLAEVQ